MPRGAWDVLSCLYCSYFSNGCGHKRSGVSASWVLLPIMMEFHLIYCPVVHPPGMRIYCFFFHCLYTSGPNLFYWEELFKGFCVVDSLHRLIHTFWTWLLLRSFWSWPRMFKTYQNGWYFKTSKAFFPKLLHAISTMTIFFTSYDFHIQWKRSSKLVICQV